MIMIFSFVILLISAFLSFLFFNGLFADIRDGNALTMADLVERPVSFTVATALAACCMILAIIGRRNPKNDGRMLFLLGVLILPCLAVMLAFHTWNLLDLIGSIVQRMVLRGSFNFTVIVHSAILCAIWAFGILAIVNDIKIIKFTMKFASRTEKSPAK